MRPIRSAVLGLIFAAAAAAGAPARAQTLAERQTTQREDAKLADAVGIANTHCATSLTASIDWPDVLQHKDKLPFATGDCEAALTALVRMCDDPMAKQAVAQKIRALRCVYAGGAKQSVALDGAGTLTCRSTSTGPTTIPSCRNGWATTRSAA